MASHKQSLLSTIFNRVPLKEKVFLTRQLSTMLGSGLAIDQAIRVMYSQTKNKTLKKAFAFIVKDLEAGNSLSFALSRHPNIFDPVFIAIVRSGESTGKMDKVLDQLADRLELSQDFNSKIRSVLMYPAFVLVVMIAIIILMMVYVVPQIKSIFEESGADLPWSTKLIIAMSNFTIHYWWVEVIIAGVLIIGGFYYFRSDKGGSLWDRMKISIPVVSNLFKMIYMARFCRTLSMLIQSGVPIIETLAITAEVISNRLYTRSLRNVAAQVEKGTPMSVPLAKDPNFPPTVTQMILVGEQTGKMEQVLNKLADFYEKETDTMIKGLSGLIEPALMVIMGIGVGFIVYSILFPIYSIAQLNF